ncbi:FecCD family ABC transporter permease [Anaerosporobacter sp.]
MKETKKHTSVLISLLVAFVLCFIISFTLGRYAITPNQLIKVLLSKIVNNNMDYGKQVEAIIFYVRMPRIIVSSVVGGALAIAGCAYQGIFKNPMVSPDVLGASSGAGFGAALAITLYLGKFMTTIMAFAFGIGSILLVCAFSKKAKKNQILGLILSGMIVSSLFSAGTSYLKLIADPNDVLPAITYWLMGSFSGVALEDIWFLLIPCVISAVVIYLLRWKINLLTMGEEEAIALGVNIKVYRIIIIICATLLTTSCVSISGMVGWVGLVIPHFSRLLVGYDNRILIPISAIMGATFMLVIDNISRLIATTEIPIGILTSLVGAPFFLYLLCKEGEEC